MRLSPRILAVLLTGIFLVLPGCGEQAESEETLGGSGFGKKGGDKAGDGKKKTPQEIGEMFAKAKSAPAKKDPNQPPQSFVNPKDVFKQSDKNSDGILTKDEYPKSFASMLENADLDKSSTISWEEFERMMHPAKYEAKDKAEAEAKAAAAQSGDAKSNSAKTETPPSDPAGPPESTKTESPKTDTPEAAKAPDTTPPAESKENSEPTQK